MNPSLKEVDQFLSQILADKSEPETDVSLASREVPITMDPNQEPQSNDEEEYFNFVLDEIIQGKEYVDPEPAAVLNTSANQFVSAAVCQPAGMTHDALAFVREGTVMATYQIPGQQQVIIPVVSVTQPTNPIVVPTALTPVAQVTPPTTSTAPPTTSTAAEVPVENPEASGTSKKRKLYEMTEFSDPNLEKRRRNAVNAKNHRQKTKETIQDLQSQLANKDGQMEELRVENQTFAQRLEEMVKAELCYQQEAEKLRREIVSLREENARLKRQEQQVAQDQEQHTLQQEKLGFDLFDLDFLN